MLLKKAEIHLSSVYEAIQTCLTFFFPLFLSFCFFIFFLSLSVCHPSFYHSLPPPHKQKRTPIHTDTTNHHTHTHGTFSQSFVMALINNWSRECSDCSKSVRQPVFTFFQESCKEEPRQAELRSHCRSTQHKLVPQYHNISACLTLPEALGPAKSYTSKRQTADQGNMSPTEILNVSGTEI